MKACAAKRKKTKPRRPQQAQQEALRVYVPRVRGRRKSSLENLRSLDSRPRPRRRRRAYLASPDELYPCANSKHIDEIPVGADASEAGAAPARPAPDTQGRGVDDGPIVSARSQSVNAESCVCVRKLARCGRRGTDRAGLLIRAVGGTVLTFSGEC